MKAPLRVLRAIPLDGPVDTFELGPRAGLDLTQCAVALLALQAAGFATIQNGTAFLTCAGRAALARSRATPAGTAAE